MLPHGEAVGTVGGGPYTLGKDGAVADVGLELPSSAVDVVGDSGG